MLLNLFIAILIQGFAEKKALSVAENLAKMQVAADSPLRKMSDTHHILVECRWAKSRM